MTLEKRLALSVAFGGGSFAGSYERTLGFSKLTTAGNGGAMNGVGVGVGVRVGVPGACAKTVKQEVA